jgi:hypothetical protein
VLEKLEVCEKLKYLFRFCAEAASADRGAAAAPEDAAVLVQEGKETRPMGRNGKLQ